MTKGAGLKTYSVAELERLKAAGVSETREDAPEAPELGPEFWKNARVVMPSGKTSVHLRLDSEVYAWFKLQGDGHLTRMNAVLRSFYEAHRGAAAKRPATRRAKAG